PLSRRSPPRRPRRRGAQRVRARSGSPPRGKGSHSPSGRCCTHSKGARCARRAAHALNRLRLRFGSRTPLTECLNIRPIGSCPKPQGRQRRLVHVERFESALWQSTSLLLVSGPEATVVDAFISVQEVRRIAARADELARA